MPAKPIPEGLSTLTPYLAVDDAAKAIDEGATLTMEVADQFWGDRFGTITDPFGHVWSIATHIEDLTPEEIEERGKAFMAGVSSN